MTDQDKYVVVESFAHSESDLGYNLQSELVEVKLQVVSGPHDTVEDAEADVELAEDEYTVIAIPGE